MASQEKNEVAVTDAPSAIRWIPLWGEFDITGDLRFKGKVIPSSPGTEPGAEAKEDQPAFGIALSNRKLSDGDVVADVTFDEVTKDSVCEIVVSYDANAARLAATGLGGFEKAMYTIREFGAQTTPGGGWWNHKMVGERANLHAGVSYHLEAKFRGANVTLSVDGIVVASADVTSPKGQERQVGVFCRGKHDVVVRGFEVHAIKPQAFVVMQFGAEYDEVYKDVVEEVVKNFEVKALRADEMAGPGLIISDIVREIGSSQLVIADISPTANANVYFEVGYALALNKPTILLARKGTPLPFDVAGFRVLFYENTIGGKGRLENGLRKHLDAILSK
jgi:hypothetical protein